MNCIDRMVFEVLHSAAPNSTNISEVWITLSTTRVAQGCMTTPSLDAPWVLTSSSVALIYFYNSLDVVVD